MTLPADRSIESRRREAVLRYPELWKRMVAEWSSDDARDAAWLLYSANYLMRTGAARWALDPLTLHWRVPEAAPVPARRDLSALSFVVLTHRHADHLDLDLLRALRGLPIPWIVPDALREDVVGVGRLASSKIIAASHGRPIEIDGIRLTPFPGLHFEGVERGAPSGAPSAMRGVPSTGYLVEWGNKRWLFPGDTRTYAASLLPRVGGVDGVFAHVWLGRGGARLADPPLREPFCRFCQELAARRVVLTHLGEFGRGAEDFWLEDHADRVRLRLLELQRDLVVERAKLGDRVAL